MLHAYLLDKNMFIGKTEPCNGGLAVLSPPVHPIGKV